MKFELTNYHSQNKFSDEELLADLRKVAEANGGEASMTMYESDGKFSTTPFIDRFGSRSEALNAAGIDPFRPKIKISDEELFENIEEVWLKLGRQPKYREFKAPLSRFSTTPYDARFGTWYKALEKFVEVANREPTEAELNASTGDSGPISDSEVSHDSKTEIIDEAKVEPTMHPVAEEGIKHKTKHDINWRMRWLVQKRDHFTCVACGRSPAKDPIVELHIDHIKPWSKGGETVLENLQTLCATCNLGKSNIE